MKKIISIGSVILISMILSGCASKSLLYAPNGKIYQIDYEECTHYTTIRDTLICHNFHNDMTTEHRPVKFCYKLDTRQSF